MKELDPLILVAVFQEMLGPVLWLILAIIVVGTVGFLALLWRERKVAAQRLVWSEALGLFGGVMALVIMAEVSSSGYNDAGGPADWVLIAVVFAVGAVGAAVLSYTAMGWICRITARHRP
jgi:hypothetical protein